MRLLPGAAGYLTQVTDDRRAESLLLATQAQERPCLAPVAYLGAGQKRLLDVHQIGKMHRQMGA